MKLLAAQHRNADALARAKSHFVPFKLPVKIRTCAIRVLHSTPASTWVRNTGSVQSRQKTTYYKAGEPVACLQGKVRRNAHRELFSLLIPEL